MNDSDDPVSSRERQLNRDIEDTPLATDRNVVYVASSIVTTTLVKLGPCSGKEGRINTFNVS